MGRNFIFLTLGTLPSEVQEASPAAKPWGPFAHEPDVLAECPGGGRCSLVLVAVISLDPNVEGGRLAFLGLSPSPCGDTLTISFSLFTSSQNILPAEMLKEEGRLLGLSLFVALKVGSSHIAFVEKALVNAGDIDSSLEQKQGWWVGLGAPITPLPNSQGDRACMMVPRELGVVGGALSCPAFPLHLPQRGLPRTTHLTCLSHPKTLLTASSCF